MGTRVFESASQQQMAARQCVLPMLLFALVVVSGEHDDHEPRHSCMEAVSGGVSYAFEFFGDYCTAPEIPTGFDVYTGSKTNDYAASPFYRSGTTDVTRIYQPNRADSLFDESAQVLADKISHFESYYDASFKFLTIERYSGYGGVKETTARQDYYKDHDITYPYYKPGILTDSDARAAIISMTSATDNANSPCAKANGLSTEWVDLLNHSFSNNLHISDIWENHHGTEAWTFAEYWGEVYGYDNNDKLDSWVVHKHHTCATAPLTWNVPPNPFDTDFGSYADDGCVMASEWFDRFGSLLLTGNAPTAWADVAAIDGVSQCDPTVACSCVIGEDSVVIATDTCCGVTETDWKVLHNITTVDTPSLPPGMCAAGYALVSGPPPDCQQCDATQNEYYPFSGPQTACLTCSVGQIAVPADAPTACECMPGYAGADGVCTACAEGEYKAASGDGACVACGAGETTLAPGAWSADQCVCDVGFGLDVNDVNSACAACPVNEFKPYAGDSACLICAEHDANSVAPTTGSSVCRCKLGHYFNADTNLCSPCHFATYKSTTGNGTCTPCLANKNTSTVGATSLDECQCLPGFTSTADSGEATCTACTTGTYQPNQGNAEECIPCGQAGEGGTTLGVGETTSADCIPIAGYYQSGVNNFLPCPDDTYRVFTTDPAHFALDSCTTCPARASSPPGSTELAACTCTEPAHVPSTGVACVCAAGYYLLDGVCAECPADSFCEGGTHVQACLDLEEAPAGSSSADACVCVAGAVRDAGTGFCQLCPAGTFESSDACAPCANGTTSAAGAVSAANCTAVEGYYKLPDGTVSACPDNMTTIEPGATSATACTCAAGYLDPACADAPLIQCTGEDLTPLCTSAATCGAFGWPGGGATYVSGSWHPWKALDGKTNTIYQSMDFYQYPQYTMWWGYDFGQEVALGKIRYRAYSSSSTAQSGNYASSYTAQAAAYRIRLGHSIDFDNMELNYDIDARFPVGSDVEVWLTGQLTRYIFIWKIPQGQEGDDGQKWFDLTELNFYAACPTSGLDCTATACEACPVGTYTTNPGVVAACDACPANMTTAAPAATSAAACTCAPGYTDPVCATAEPIRCAAEELTTRCTSAATCGAFGWPGDGAQYVSGSWHPWRAMDGYTNTIYQSMNFYPYPQYTMWWGYDFGQEVALGKIRYRAYTTAKNSEGQYAMSGNYASSYTAQAAAYRIRLGYSIDFDDMTANYDIDARFPVGSDVDVWLAGELTRYIFIWKIPQGQEGDDGQTWFDLTEINFYAACPTSGQIDCTTTACEACPVHTYKAGLGPASCDACPIEKLAPAGSTDEAACLCPAGQVDNGAECVDCATGTYRTDGDDAACTPCGEGATTTGTGAVLRSECQCSAGHTPDGDACAPCAAGAYKRSIGNESCIVAGAGDVTLLDGQPWSGTGSTDFTCKAGYTWYNDIICALCPTGTYKTEIGLGACTTCPALTESLADRTACRCIAGYVVANSTCVACVENSYADVGAVSCTSCPPQSYAPSASVNITQCECGPGFAGDLVETNEGYTLTCSPCEAGTAKVGNGNTPCPDCQQNAWSDIGALECNCLPGFTPLLVTVPVNPLHRSYSATAEYPIFLPYFNYGRAVHMARTFVLPFLAQYYPDIDSVVCNDPVDNAPCKLSEQVDNYAIEYSEVDNPSLAFNRQVSSGVYIPETGGILARLYPNAWAPTTEFMFAPIAADNPYTHGPSGYDISQQGGKVFIFLTGSNDCVACPADTYKTENGSATCTPCPEFTSHTLTGSETGADCVCDDGYTGDFATGCTACPAGWYRPVDTNECVACPDGTVASGATGASDLDAACLCAPGTTGLASTGCGACLANSFQPAAGATTCESCPEFSTSPEAATSADNCTCDADYVRSTEPTLTCELGCPAGFSAGPADLECFACTAGTYKPTSGSGACLACPEHSTHSLLNASTVDACLCAQGFLRAPSWPEPAACDACEAGTFNNRVNSTVCHECYAEDTNNVCTPDATQNTTACVGLCQVPAGQGAIAVFGDVLSNFAPCGPGTWNDGAYVLCQPCPTGTTHDLTGATSVAACYCMPGYLLTGAQCSACAPGTYKPDAGNDTACVACPSGATSPAGATGPEQCVCAAGYGTEGSDASACAPCAEGTQKFVDSNEPCIACPADSTLLADSTHTSESCVCEAGFTGDAGSCTPCATGTYKAEAGTAACTACGEYFTSPEGATTAAACECDGPLYVPDPQDPSVCIAACGVGEFLDADDSCAFCAENSYKETVGNEACTPCPEPHTRGPEGSSNVSNCVCPVGAAPLNADAMFSVDSLDLYTGSAGTDYNSLPVTLDLASAPLHNLMFAADDPHIISLERHGALLAFHECESACAGTVLFDANTHRLSGTLHISSRAGPTALTGTLTVNQYTRRALTTTPVLPNALLADAETWAAGTGARSGAVLFDSAQPLTSDEDCVACPASMVCAGETFQPPPLKAACDASLNYARTCGATQDQRCETVARYGYAYGSVAGINDGVVAAFETWPFTGHYYQTWQVGYNAWARIDLGEQRTVSEIHFNALNFRDCWKDGGSFYLTQTKVLGLSTENDAEVQERSTKDPLGTLPVYDFGEPHTEITDEMIAEYALLADPNDPTWYQDKWIRMTISRTGRYLYWVARENNWGFCTTEIKVLSPCGATLVFDNSANI